MTQIIGSLMVVLFLLTVLILGIIDGIKYWREERDPFPLKCIIGIVWLVIALFFILLK